MVSGGPQLAAQVAVCGLAVFANLVLAERATTRFVANAVTKQDPAAAGGLLFKQLTTLPLALALMMTLGPEAVALAWLSLFSGIFLYAAVRVLHDRDAQLSAHLVLTESRC